MNPSNEGSAAYRDMSVRDLQRFFAEHPEADEYTWINGSKVRFSDVLRKAREEIEDAHYQAREEAAMNYDG